MMTYLISPVYVSLPQVPWQGSHRVWKTWKTWKNEILWKSHGKSGNFEIWPKVMEKSGNFSVIHDECSVQSYPQLAKLSFKGGSGFNLIVLLAEYIFWPSCFIYLETSSFWIAYGIVSKRKLGWHIAQGQVICWNHGGHLVWGPWTCLTFPHTDPLIRLAFSIPRYIQ